VEPRDVRRKGFAQLRDAEVVRMRHCFSTPVGLQRR
jgi:hypothetical protein